MKRIVYYLLLLFVAQQASPATVLNGHYYELGSNQEWNSARILAGMFPAPGTTAYGYLIVIESEEEHNLADNMCGTSCWTGGNDRSSEEDWEWSATGEQFWQETGSCGGSGCGYEIGGAYTNWKSNQPNNWGNSEDCMSIEADGYWYDYDCDSNKDYIIEFDDYNECLLGHDNCTANGNCTNTFGSYSCDCFTGWNGTRCGSDIDECGAGVHNCATPGGLCVNTNGSYVCECETGWNGTVCDVDVDECALGTDDCYFGSECVNTVGSFVCNCSSGYTGPRCDINVDECGTATHDCSVHASCTDSAGSYFCSCNAGYAGSGYECTDVNECTDGLHSCAVVGGVCNNTAGSFTCTCGEGYVGSGLVCTEVTTQTSTSSSSSSSTSTTSVTSSASTSSSSGSSTSATPSTTATTTAPTASSSSTPPPTSTSEGDGGSGDANEIDGATSGGGGKTGGGEIGLFVGVGVASVLLLCCGAVAVVVFARGRRQRQPRSTGNGGGGPSGKVSGKGDAVEMDSVVTADSSVFGLSTVGGQTDTEATRVVGNVNQMASLHATVGAQYATSEYGTADGGYYGDESKSGGGGGGGGGMDSVDGGTTLASMNTNQPSNKPGPVTGGVTRVILPAMGPTMVIKDSRAAAFSTTATGVSEAALTNEAPVVDGLSDCKLLGQGGQATIYKALSYELGKAVVIKVFKNADDFAREVDILAAAGEHENVVKTVAVSNLPPSTLALEMATYGSLVDYIETKGVNGLLPPTTSLQIASDVARGLAHLHSRGVCHLDTKPDNILIKANGLNKVSAVVTDFGASFVVGRSDLRVDQCTVRYAAP